jgi:hypothetical protein
MRSAPPPPLFYKRDLETESWTHGSPALGGKEFTAEPPTQPIPNETRTLSPQNPVCIPCGHLWRLRSSKPSPTSLFGVHSKFRTAPDSRSPTVSRWPGVFGTSPVGLQAHCQRLWPRFLAALGASCPPSSCLLTQPAGMGRDWSPGLRGHRTSVCLASVRGY